MQVNNSNTILKLKTNGSKYKYLIKNMTSNLKVV